MRAPIARPRQTRVETAFTALRIEGGLFPAEFLQRVAALAAPGQSAEEYALPPGRSVRDEIGRYWSIADALWREYRRDRLRTDIDARRTGIERWLTRLLRDVFGYSDLTRPTGPTQIGDRHFPLSHRAHDGAVPLLLTLADHDLDRSHAAFGDEGRRRAPHAAMQEYLNAEAAALWGIVANGPRLRLLRDNPTLTRPAFVEADLERIFEEGLYPDFAALWLMVHASRTAPGAGGVAGCWLERWRAEGAKTGQRALERLRAGVTTALRELGSGFVEHPENAALRAALGSGSLTADALHQQLLRLVYRLLLLFTAEERGLLHAPDATPAARSLYADGYGLARLRDRARLKRHYDRYADLWTGLTITFRALGTGAPSLGLPALGGLFDETQCPDLDSATLPNTRLLAAIHALAYFSDAGSLQRVNYRDMGTEELGSVYESLLELHPVVQVATRPWSFSFIGDETGEGARGSERKLSGSYYTPDSLVQELLRSALDPVIERAVRDNPSDPRGALLKLRVLDPACGSGHFLLGAARRLADAVARLDMDGDLPDEAVRRHALREVVRRCIFGVDRNPLSVELCKTALWIEAIEPGKPLTFLDAHIKCGDSLIGVADLAVLRAGIPDEAFKELTGDNKTYARDLRKRNKAERENPTFTLLPEVTLPPDLAAAMAALTDAPEDDLGAVRTKVRALESLRSGRAAYDLRVACDLWCAAFFSPRAARPELRGRDMVPTTDTVWRYLRAPSTVYGPLVGLVEGLRSHLRFFHWPLEFPDAMAAGGFDCVLGNPPWERIKLQEQEFFAARSPEIANALNKAARDKLITALASAPEGGPDRALSDAFVAAKREAEATSEFVRVDGSDGGRFPLTGRGDVNTYGLFAELVKYLKGKKGFGGIIVPSEILSGDASKTFFQAIIVTGELDSAVSFENEEFIFPGIANVNRFSLLTLGPCRTEKNRFRFAFFLRNADQMRDNERYFEMSKEDFFIINPNSGTCPVFRSNFDASLTAKIFKRVPVFQRDSDNAPGVWPVNFVTMFHMANDSELFSNDPAKDFVPLYEAKFIWHFDHRFSSYHNLGIEKGRGGRGLPPVSLQEYNDPNFEIQPRYWVPKTAVESALKSVNWQHQWLIGWRDITNAKVERTVAFSVIPRFGVGHTMPLMFSKESPNKTSCLIANLNSIVLDYVARQTVSGTHLTYGFLKQFPILRPAFYNEHRLAFIVPRVIELTYTSHALTDFARDLGYGGLPFAWDEARRAHLRAELDAAYAHFYGLTRDELRYILDPADIYGPDFPSETFRVLKERECRQYGEYRTARLVLAAWDRLTSDGTFRSWTA